MPKVLPSCVFLLCGVLWAQTLSASTPDASSPVAIYLGGHIRATDIAREATFLSKDESMFRNVAKHNATRKQRDWATRMAMRRLVELKVATGELTLNTDQHEQIRAAAREWAMTQWRAACFGEQAPKVNEQQIAHQLQGQEITLPRRARLSHIFLKSGPQRSDAQARKQLQRWRTNNLNLDQFRVLATKFSDSESAQRGGSLGLLRPEHLPKEASHVFKQAAGTISEPIKLPGGWHLFFVEQVLPSRILPLQKQIDRSIAAAQLQRLNDCRKKALSRVQSNTAPTTDGLITIGDWRIAKETLLRLYSDRFPEPSQLLAWYTEQERLYQHMHETKQLTPEQTARAKDLSADKLLEIYFADKLRSRLGKPTEKELRQLYNTTNPKPRSARRIQLKVLHTQIPDDQLPLRFDERIKQLASTLPAEQSDWNLAIQQLPKSSTLEIWPLMDLAQLAGRLGPKVFDQVRRLALGDTSKPIRDRRDYFVVHVLQDIPARDLTYAEAHDKLFQKWRLQQRRILRHAITEEILHRGKYRYLGHAASEAIQPIQNAK